MGGWSLWIDPSDFDDAESEEEEDDDDEDDDDEDDDDDDESVRCDLCSSFERRV